MIRLLWSELDRLPDNAEYLENVLHGTFTGFDWLERGLHCIETYGIKAKDVRDRYQDLHRIVLRVLGIKSLADSETEADLIGMLSQFSEKTLLIALPYAGCARVGILKAIGWEDLIPVQQHLFRIVGAHAGYIRGNDAINDVSNCEDPSSGVLDRTVIRSAT